MLGFGPIGSAPLGAIPENLIVDLDPTDQGIREISRQLAELRAAILTGSATSEAAVAASEVAELERALELPRIRLAPFMDKSVSTLGWVAKMAAGGAVAKVGSELLILIAQHFGVELR